MENQNIIDALTNFDVQKSMKMLESILQDFNWTLEDISKDDGLVQCPFNKGHRVPKTKLETHSELCQWKSKGYTTKEAEKLNELCSINDDNTVTIDDSVFKELGIKSEVPIPITANDAFIDLTTDERLSIHHYVLEKARSSKRQKLDISGQELLPESETKDSESQSFAKMLKDHRDAHRRRKSYRGVHTAKKSYKQVIGEVINEQTEELRKTWDVERREKKRHKRHHSDSSRSHHHHKKSKKSKKRD